MMILAARPLILMSGTRSSCRWTRRCCLKSFWYVAGPLCILLSFQTDNPQAANYLDIKALLDVGCKTVANMIKGKSPEEIRKTFNIQNDFTPEEEDQIRRENEWAEEYVGACLFPYILDTNFSRCLAASVIYDLSLSLRLAALCLTHLRLRVLDGGQERKAKGIQWVDDMVPGSFARLCFHSDVFPHLMAFIWCILPSLILSTISLKGAACFFVPSANEKRCNLRPISDRGFLLK